MRLLLLPLLLAVLGLSLPACEHASFNDFEDQQDPLTNFDELWKSLEERYTYWDLKGIDRDSLHQVHRVGAFTANSRVELFLVFEGLLNSLRDGHTNLLAEFDYTRYWEPFETRPENFDRGVLIRNYWGNYRISGGLVYTVIDSVGYLYIEDFSQAPSGFSLDYAISAFQQVGVKGVVVDLRSNGGGRLQNAINLISRFTPQNLLVARNRFKSGPGPDDWSEADELQVEPGETLWQGPVAVLTNRRCYSATNFAAYGLSLLDNVTLIGDSTSGGGGFPISRELPIGWQYRFSGSRMVGPDGWELELPLPPDIRQDNDPFQQAAGVDQILERALQEVG